MEVPAISHNLLMILNCLKDEDKNGASRKLQPLDESRFSEYSANDTQINGAMGENLEYFIENKIIETLSAYALTDTPQGFFKFLLGAIEDLIKSINR